MALFLLHGCTPTKLQQDVFTVFLYGYIPTYFFVKLSTLLMYLILSLSQHTSKDECGNGNREVLGQSLGTAGRMHWTVVGGAASMGKGRPGPISIEREENGAPIRTQAVRNIRSERSQGAREKERDAHNNQHHNIATMWKRKANSGFVFLPLFAHYFILKYLTPTGITCIALI